MNILGLVSSPKKLMTGQRQRPFLPLLSMMMYAQPLNWALSVFFDRGVKKSLDKATELYLTFVGLNMWLSKGDSIFGQVEKMLGFCGLTALEREYLNAENEDGGLSILGSQVEQNIEIAGCIFELAIVNGDIHASSNLFINFQKGGSPHANLQMPQNSTFMIMV